MSTGRGESGPSSPGSRHLAPVGSGPWVAGRRRFPGYLPPYSGCSAPATPRSGVAHHCSSVPSFSVAGLGSSFWPPGAGPQELAVSFSGPPSLGHCGGHRVVPQAGALEDRPKALLCCQARRQAGLDGQESDLEAALA